jgi:hypothetical protein
MTRSSRSKEQTEARRAGRQPPRALDRSRLAGARGGGGLMSLLNTSATGGGPSDNGVLFVE